MLKKKKVIIKKRKNRQDLTLINLHAIKKIINSNNRLVSMAIIELDRRITWLEKNWFVS